MDPLGLPGDQPNERGNIPIGQTPEETPEPVGHWKVDASFYVEADSARDAERRVTNEINSPAIQKYIGDTVGDVDVHEGDTIEWDMEG